MQAGSSYNVTWADNISENVKIDLFKGGVFAQTIFSSTLSDGSESWTVPSNLASGSDYQIKISSVNNANLADLSNSNFSVNALVWNVSFINRNSTNYASVNDYDFSKPDATMSLGSQRGFTYQATPFETLTIDASKNVAPAGQPKVYSSVLELGKHYRLEVSGQVLYALPLSNAFADAKFFTSDNWGTNGDISGTVELGLSSTALGQNNDDFWGSYRPDHVYTYEIVGNGQAVDFYFNDTDFSNNQGTYTVKIYREEATANTSSIVLKGNFGLGSPAPNVQADYFVMQAWTTTKLESGKNYQVTTQSDDGTRFFVKNVATGEITYIGSDWRNRGAIDPAATAFFSVSKTGDYDFYVQMFDVTSASTVNVELKETPANGLPNHTGLLNDINKDGKTDILWRNYNDGTTHFWSMNGATNLGGVDIPDYSDMAWHPVALADFNNDGNMDIVWRYNWIDNTGWNRIWLMNGSNRIAEFDIERVADNNWHIVGTGDFNLDGNVDILWRNYASGENVVWKMAGTDHVGNISIETEADLNWRVVGTGDFNSDGKSDILWRNEANGVNAIWFMNGTTVTSKPLVETVALDWSIKGTGDFNNDGKSDIVWRNNNNGANVVWLMNGNTHSGDLDIPDVDRNWNIVGKSDPVAIWTAEYFGNKDLAGTPTYSEGFVNITGGFSKDWGGGAPPNTPADGFSARYKTQQYLAAGLYKVNVLADDGVRVWVGGSLIINDWSDTVGTRFGYFTSTGGYYPVQVEYKEAGGLAYLNYEIVKHQAFDDSPDASKEWAALVLKTDGAGTPSANYNDHVANAIGTIKLARRNDGKEGISAYWGTGSPNGDSRLPVDNFFIRAHTISYFDGGEYKFRFKADDGIQLFAYGVWGTQVEAQYITPKDQWVEAYGYKEVTYTMPAGWYTLHFQMWEGGIDALVDVSWEKVVVIDPNYIYRDADYLNALYQDNLANGIGQSASQHGGPIDSDDSAPNGADSDNTVYALVGGEVIEAKNGKQFGSAVFDNWIYNGTVAIYNKDLNKTFIYWHFAEGSIDESLKGKTISAGSRIGVEGSTGYSFAVHTHVEVHEGRKTVDMSKRQVPANSGRLYLPTIFQDAVRNGLVKLYQ